MIKGAGILIVDKNRKALFLKRGPGGDAPLMWCIPGGRLEDGEEAIDAAVREVQEEAGYKAKKKDLSLLARTLMPQVSGDPAVSPTPPTPEKVDFTTFLCQDVEPFTPVLGPEAAPEHIAFAWAPVDQPPEPLHPGCRLALDRLSMDELGIARAMATGELASPQRYHNITLFAIRITGTGAAYRQKLDEYVWRDPSVYLNDDFLARCNGLAVIWEHPPTDTLTTTEYRKRSIGAIMLPFIRGSEVWGIAKVHDDEAAAGMAKLDLSTSPGVVLRDADTTQLQLGNGSALLIEGKPKVLDHVAICALGVWDKGGPPAGVLSSKSEVGERAMADTTAAGAETSVAALLTALDQKLTPIVTRLDSAFSRLDSIENMRKDEDKAKEEEKKKADRKDRVDAARKDKFGRKDGEDEKSYTDRMDADEKAMCDELEKGGINRDDAKLEAAAARKDAVEMHRSDKARRDAEEEKKRSDSALAVEQAKNADLTARLSALETSMRGLTVETPAEERDAISAARSRADAVAAMFGERVEANLPGETALAYRKRILRPFLRHNEHLKDAGEAITRADAVLLKPLEDAVYADAELAAKRADTAMVGKLIAIRTPDAAGRTITTYRGDNLAWMAPFMTNGRVVTFNRDLKPRI